MATSKNTTRQAQARDASVIAQGSNENGWVITIYRRGMRYSEGANVAARIEAVGAGARSTLLRLAASTEEALMKSPHSGPLCIEKNGDGGGKPFLWIESDGADIDVQRDTNVMLEAARNEGFKVPRKAKG